MFIVYYVVNYLFFYSIFTATKITNIKQGDRGVFSFETIKFSTI